MTRPHAVATVIVDDDRTRVTRYEFAIGAETGWHRHGVGYVIVPLTHCTIEVEGEDGTITTTEVATGAAYARPAGARHNVRNAGVVPMAFVEIELKG
jgi:mannose-6-phosphate isomerase-like protein (cupin superfamily)